MTTLITGAGLVGTSYALVAAERGERSVFLDPIPREDYLADRLGDIDYAVVREDVRSLPGLLGAINEHGADTVILTGVTMAGCVRHTCEDAIAEGFRPIVVRECVGDRVPGVVEWNLFDIDAKFGDVEPLDSVLEYLDRIDPVPLRNTP